jgi:hypothetical protein
MTRKEYVTKIKNNLTLCGLVMAVFVCCSAGSCQSRAADWMGETLDAYDWNSYVGNKTGIWVSIKRQELMLIENGRLVKSYACSTAAAGAGNAQDSGMTPLGWHRIGVKIGDDLPAGAVLVERQWTGRVWKPGQDTQEDLILSRILWLDGLEEGKNRGGTIDSRNRYIYIHGTNQADKLGTPASAGCVRLDPQAVIDLFKRVKEGCCVLITEA